MHGVSCRDLTCTFLLLTSFVSRETTSRRRLINLDRKWFVKQFGPDGLHTLLAGFDNKSAQAICTFAYCEGPGKQPLLFQGRTTVRLPQANLVDVVADLRVQGKIVPARGPRDFGQLRVPANCHNY